ncbi:hypothetical protein LR48_Vigan09g101200 [Vigna angularis]|uniref:Uncharacterized protein n=1 Tax=Phaseolus angularis TaxID=3914 RepID=A0A0L9VBG3_PHAAN|nr:hypothetical protein LR48_Vigan09g101200 [Vigna angularis]
MPEVGKIEDVIIIGSDEDEATLDKIETGNDHQSSAAAFQKNLLTGLTASIGNLKRKFVSSPKLDANVLKGLDSDDSSSSSSSSSSSPFDMDSLPLPKNKKTRTDATSLRLNSLQRTNPNGKPNTTVGTTTVDKKIMSCKYVRLGYYRFYGFQFPNLFEDQATTKVKGVYITLDDDIWTNVTMMTIRDDVVKVHLGIEGFNHLLAFQSFLRNPQQQQGTNNFWQMDEMSMLHQTMHEELFDMHQSHYSYVTEHFEDFDVRLGNIEDCLNFQPPDQPPSPTF